jgi:hypothetical protein
MVQKITWLIFLIFGINLISCKKNTAIDYKVNLNFVFVNNTKYNIRFNENANVLNVAPLSKSVYSISTEGNKELTKESFLTSPVLPLCNTCIVFFNETKCDTLKGRGIENIKNFEFTKIKQGEYELKYTFNESDYLSSKNCR